MNKYSTTTTTTIIHHSQSSSSMSLLLLISMLSFITLSTSAAVETSLLLYKDPRVPTEDRVTDLLSRMTLPEKIGQMSQIDRSVASPEVIKNLFIGSILNGGTSAPAPDTTPSQWADMIDAFQKSSMETRLQIPMIYGTDAVHGHNNVFGSTIFPHNIGLGAARDEDLMVRIGKATALEIRATGIPYTFAPCIAVCRDPRWGRCYESYSEDTDIVRSMSKIILGLQGVPPVNYTKGYPFVAGGNKVIGCAKHYVGDGGTIEGTNEHNTVSSYSDLFQVHIRPYIDALEMSVSTVMVSYSSWNGIKTHANPYLLSKVLKQEFGFQGFLISDWEGIDRVTSPPGSNYKNSVKEVINAGVDMVMIPTNYQKFITDLMELVLSGDVPMTRIDDAVRRILRVKFIAGMFEQPNADRSLLGNIVGSKKHRELAREAVRKSLVLLKNGKGGKQILPLSKYAPKVLVAGTHANDIGYQCGGWTITWNGSPGNTTIGTTILQGIKGAISKRTKVVFEEKPDQQFMQNNKDFSYSIVAVGEPPYAESQGDDKNLTLSPDAIETIRNVCSKTKCLVIIISGRPLVIEPYLGMIEALVAAWLPGSEAGNGIADVIFGKYDFKGTTILQGIESTVSERTEVVFEEKPDQQFMQNNKDFSYAIVAVGEPPYAVSQDDNNKLTLSPDAIETIRNVCSKTKCLVIVVSGRPMVIEPYVGMMEALVAAWLPGSEAGNGIADVIFGKYDFTGKLPRTWFRRVDQLPMNFGDPHYDPGLGFDVFHL